MFLHALHTFVWVAALYRNVSAELKAIEKEREKEIANERRQLPGHYLLFQQLYVRREFVERSETKKKKQ
uniref:Putative secreted protein n=1 Tax=Anopheles darlingi TaxID=43151 RepID=A0A2M4DBK0_ANODA